VPDFASPAALAQVLASRVAEALSDHLAGFETATVAVSGGTTPVAFFGALSHAALPWSRIRVTLADERDVADDHVRSNARLVRTHLLQNEAAAAHFIAIPDLTEADLPLAAAVLGMGLDGHTASLFPGGDRLAEALAGPHLYEAISAPDIPEARLTLTLPVLNAARYVALHIEGEAKRATLRAAQRPGPVPEYPVRGLLARQPGPDIFWCP
jgi:6-phosphogluconolactonase